MATTRKSARRSTARRKGGKLKRRPKASRALGRAAKPHRQKVRRKPGTNRRPRPQPRPKPAPRQRKAVRRKKALETFGDRLLEAAEAPVSPSREPAPSAADEGAPSYYTGDRKPSVAEPGPESISRNGEVKH